MKKDKKVKVLNMTQKDCKWHQTHNPSYLKGLADNRIAVQLTIDFSQTVKTIIHDVH